MFLLYIYVSIGHRWWTNMYASLCGSGCQADLPGWKFPALSLSVEAWHGSWSPWRPISLSITPQSLRFKRDFSPDSQLDADRRHHAAECRIRDEWIHFGLFIKFLPVHECFFGDHDKNSELNQQDYRRKDLTIFSVLSGSSVMEQDVDWRWKPPGSDADTSESDAPKN